MVYFSAHKTQFEGSYPQICFLLVNLVKLGNCDIFLQCTDILLAIRCFIKHITPNIPPNFYFFSLESYVVGACLKSAAMIIKRGILDGKSGDQEELYQFIHQMLTNESSTIQAAGCLFISALIEQFSSAWRNSKFSITWDFHLQAKSTFEVIFRILILLVFIILFPEQWTPPSS